MQQPGSTCCWVIRGTAQIEKRGSVCGFGMGAIVIDKRRMKQLEGVHKVHKDWEMILAGHFPQGWLDAEPQCSGAASAERSGLHKWTKPEKSISASQGRCTQNTH